MTENSFLPKKFFVVAGKAACKTSILTAFDKALMQAGIAQCNIVNVSSILPDGAEEIKPIEIPAGTITFAVLARQDGTEGETIGCGIGWAWCEDAGGKKYGIVAEEHGYKEEKYIKEELQQKLKAMADSRELVVKEMKTKVVGIDIIPEDHYGSTIAALIYVPW